MAANRTLQAALWSRMARSPRGFTLVELMVVVALVAVLAALAAPSMRGYASQQRVKNASLDLMNTLLQARSEAVKRNDTVNVTPLTAGNWAAGWQVAVTAGPLVHQGAYSSVNFACSGGGCAGLSYDGTGRLTGSAARVQVSSPDATAVRCITVDLSGRPRTAKSACPS